MKQGTRRYYTVHFYKSSQWSSKNTDELWCCLTFNIDKNVIKKTLGFYDLAGLQKVVFRLVAQPYNKV